MSVLPFLILHPLPFTLSLEIHSPKHTCCSESVPLLSVGASLTVIFPSAFVALSSAATQALSPVARLRVTSSGAFHNLMLWLVLTAAVRLGVGTALWSLLGYTDISAWGRVVIGVESGSPLNTYLPVGTIITKIDDKLLTTSDPSLDLWTTLLSEGTKTDSSDDLGWCVDRP